MPRHFLDETRLHSAIRHKVETNRRDIVDEVIAATKNHPVVVVGMAHNPHCHRVRKSLSAAAIKYTYLEYGNYLSQWRRRTALKMWTGWPTFPMVFIHGNLVGGDSDVAALIKAGELEAML